MTTESSTTRMRILSPGWSWRLFRPPMVEASLELYSCELEFFDQDLFCEWLHDVLIRACFEGCRHLVNFRLGGYHHHHQRWKLGILTQIFEQIQTIHLRHVPIHQNQVHFVVFSRHYLKSFPPIRRSE